MQLVDVASLAEQIGVFLYIMNITFFYLIYKKLRVCLVTVFPLIFCFKKQFSIFETRKLVWQPKIDRKQKPLSKLNL